MIEPLTLPRLHLVHGPTPIVPAPASLRAALGIELYIKRDDATGGAEAGNKIRKLEFLLADAIVMGAKTVITCGGLQSNHARATAVAAAALGLRTILFLRSPPEMAGDPRVSTLAARLPRTGNVLIDRWVGADIRCISHADYARRRDVMSAAKATRDEEGDSAYVIPEGGSNGLGSLGYVEAMREVREQIDIGLGGGRPFDEIVVACGSGGTAAGIALGAREFEVAEHIRAVAVCDSAAYFEAAIETLQHEAQALASNLSTAARITVDESARGPGYGTMTPAQRKRIVRVARESGIVLDPVYTGKAFLALMDAAERGEIAKGARVLFWHTGGLPGLLADGDAFAEDL